MQAHDQHSKLHGTSRAPALQAAATKAPLRAQSALKASNAPKSGGTDLDAVAEALTATPSHDAGCALCAAGGHHDGQEFKAETGPGLECPGIDVGQMQKKVDEAANKQKDAVSKKNEPSKEPGAGAADKKSGDAPAKSGSETKGAGDKKEGAGGKDAKGGAGAAGGKGADAKAPVKSEGKTAGKGAADQKASLAAAGADARAMVQNQLNSQHDLAAGVNSWGNPGGFPRVLGLTTINRAGFVAPVIDFDVTTTPAAGSTPASATAKFKPTAATDAVHPCTSAPAADNVVGTRTVPDGKGGTVACDVIVRVTAAYARKIWAAEQEHLDDLQRAFDISLKKAALEINGLTARTFTGATENDAKKAAKDELATKVPAKLGTDHTQYADIVWRLCRLSGSGRDALSYHTFGVTAPTTDVAAKKIIVELNDGATQIGTHSSAAVVDFAHI